MNEETKRCALARPGSSQGRRRELARRKRLPDGAPDATLETRQPRNPLRRRGSKVRVTSGLPPTRHLDDQLKKKNKKTWKGRKQSDPLAISGKSRPVFCVWEPRPALARLPWSPSAGGPAVRKAGAPGGKHVGVRARQEVGPVHGGYGRQNR